MSTEHHTTPRFRQFLVNPFHYLAGGKALTLGLAILLLSGLVASFSNTHFDGVLDAHTGRPAALWQFLLEGIINWICLALLLWLCGLLASGSKIRAIDIFGTQALARAPMLITALVMLFPGVSRFAATLLHQATGAGASVDLHPADPIVFGLSVLLMLVMTAWMVYLMYRSFTLSCNLKGGKAIALFIVALLVAEVASKLAILFLLDL